MSFKRNFLSILLLGGWFFSMTASAWTKDPEAAVVVPPQQLGVGRLLPHFQAKDLNNQLVSSEQLLKQYDYLVVALTSTSCPITKKYAPTLGKLEAEFAPRRVGFVYVNPIATDGVAQMQETIKNHRLQGPYIHDREHKLVAALGAESTAECFIIDRSHTLRYRGAIDDQYGLGYSLAVPKREFLKSTLNELLNNQPVRIEATTAPGCALDLAKGVDTELTTVTYHNRISRIIAAQCQECHRAGGVGPFELETYEQVLAHKGMIRKVVEKGTMPPWHAAEETTYPGRWANDRSLTPNDKADLLNWLKYGASEGNPADAPLPRVYHGDWKIGTPDMILQLPEPISIPATGIMEYQHVLVATNTTEEKWLQAYEIQPSDRAVVHHVLVHVILPTEDRPGTVLERLQNLAEARRGGVFAAYVPGNDHLIFPEGSAKRLPAGARLLFQIHYTPNGTATKDQMKIGLKFAKQAPEREVRVTGIANTRIKIPPMVENHTEIAYLKARIPDGAYITAFMPHTHVRGKACKYELIAPDGSTQTLLDVPHYDFNWQLRYELAQPLKVQPGSQIKFTVVYDNSPNNPANPDPSITVRWGDQTSEEMMLGYLEYYYARPNSK